MTEMIEKKEIKVLGICELLENVLGLDRDYWMHLTWDVECKLVNDWAKKNNYYVYSECKEDFFEWEAIDLAEKGGFDGVVMENLS